MKRYQNPDTADEYMSALAARIDQLERRRQPSMMEFYVQPDEPETTTFGALWFDTDEPVP